MTIAELIKLLDQHKEELSGLIDKNNKELANLVEGCSELILRDISLLEKLKPDSNTKDLKLAKDSIIVTLGSILEAFQKAHAPANLLLMTKNKSRELLAILDRTFKPLIARATELAKQQAAAEEKRKTAEKISASIRAQTDIIAAGKKLLLSSGLTLELLQQYEEKPFVGCYERMKNPLRAREKDPSPLTPKKPQAYADLRAKAKKRQTQALANRDTAPGTTTHKPVTSPKH